MCDLDGTIGGPSHDRPVILLALWVREIKFNSDVDDLIWLQHHGIYIHGSVDEVVLCVVLGVKDRVLGVAGPSLAIFGVASVLIDVSRQIHSLRRAVRVRQLKVVARAFSAAVRPLAWVTTCVVKLKERVMVPVLHVEVSVDLSDLYLELIQGHVEDSVIFIDIKVLNLVFERRIGDSHTGSVPNGSRILIGSLVLFKSPWVATLHEPRTVTELNSSEKRVGVAIDNINGFIFTTAGAEGHHVVVVVMLTNKIPDLIFSRSGDI